MRPWTTALNQTTPEVTSLMPRDRRDGHRILEKTGVIVRNVTPAKNVHLASAVSAVSAYVGTVRVRHRNMSTAIGVRGVDVYKMDDDRISTTAV